MADGMKSKLSERKNNSAPSEFNPNSTCSRCAQASSFLFCPFITCHGVSMNRSQKPVTIVNCEIKAREALRNKIHYVNAVERIFRILWILIKTSEKQSRGRVSNQNQK